MTRFQIYACVLVSVQVHDNLDFNDTEQHCLISKCRTKNSKNCNILLTDAHFISNLTNKTYFTRSYDDKNCKKSLKIPKG